MLGPEIAVPMRILNDKCFTQGYFPLEMKIAKIIPIHNKWDEETCSNYQPIAVHYRNFWVGNKKWVGQVFRKNGIIEIIPTWIQKEQKY